ncbi:hypothetical protein N9S35_01405 [Candidatus Pelagibacter bacterium]|nr:hypothetical protein [Candidatus Pelagibacter bacterium]MDA9619237.1 hypothetical protein [Candidatus Pelagibacter bacterium]
MKLKSFNYFVGLLIIFLYLPLLGEEKIDIWKNKKEIAIDSPNQAEKNNQGKPDLLSSQTIQTLEKIQIEESSQIQTEEQLVYGIFEPANFDFDLNMWSATKAEDLRSSLKRLNKIDLSKSSNEILEAILFSFSYPPKGMNEKEFIDLKINWLIENDRVDLLESFLKQNKKFGSKSKAVQYLVDKNIASGNIKEGCKQIKFIDTSIKDSYLEKFKIYCLIFNDKKPEAQLLLDLLREQKQSSKFYDDKINFLLGVTNKTNNKINEKNLLDFYLSSITIADFKYEPTKKTKPEIWKYLNAANLISLEDASDKEKLKELEIAANNDQLDKTKIFEIYKQIPFNLNTLINAKSNYQTLNESDARALIFQKYLLSEANESKIEYLFLLEELFKKADLTKIYSKYLSDRIEEIGIENLPEKYQEIAQARIVSEEDLILGKVKYNDKILHQSKILKYYVEGESKKKVQKDIDKIFKKITKNKKYFISAKDLALADALITDGFSLPSNFKYNELADKFDIPSNLLKLIENDQKAFLALKIVEIIGEDEPYQLDPETIYFVTNLLNKMNLVKIRNKVLNSALPLRT